MCNIEQEARLPLYWLVCLCVPPAPCFCSMLLNISWQAQAISDMSLEQHVFCRLLVNMKRIDEDLQLQ